MANNTRELKPDIVLKNYWSDNEQFADLFNAVLFEGRQVIKPEELENIDSEESTVLEHREYVESIKASRDNMKICKKSTIYGVEQPNITHKVLAELEKIGKLKAVVTQNIDGLHQKAGSKTVYEIHGTTQRNYCHKCKMEYHPACFCRIPWETFSGKWRRASIWIWNRTVFKISVQNVCEKTFLRKCGRIYVERKELIYMSKIMYYDRDTLHMGNCKENAGKDGGRPSVVGIYRGR